MRYHFYVTIIFLLCLILSCSNKRKIKANEIDVKILAKSIKSWNNDTLRHYLSGQPEVTILKITIPPNTELKWHKHPVINAGIVLKGELMVIGSNGDTLHLKEGEPIIEMVESFHYGKNIGDCPVEIIVFYAGIENTPNTIYK